MKCFEVALLWLDAVNSDTTLQAMLLNTQFFNFLSPRPPNSIDELLQRGNQYTMLENDVIT